MLHIVNGDHVGEMLRRGGMAGDILPWRELYTEGPIARDPYGEARADYMIATLGIPREKWNAAASEQKEALASAAERKEIVLWFEHDLYDQTMLIFLLHELERLSLDRTRLSLVCIGEYPGIEPFHGLGQLTPEQLIPLAAKRQEIRPEELNLGRKAWEAYSSADPRALTELLEGDTGALPFLRDALRMQLARFPTIRNGLGIVEQATLEALGDHARSPVELFRQVTDRLSLLGLGDLQYWLCLKRMSQGAHPLISLDPPVRYPGYDETVSELIQAKIRLTEMGAKVWSGKEDWIARNGIDLWLGGVHLQGKRNVWRWDEERSVLERK